MGFNELPSVEFFQDVTFTPPDAIFELTKDYNADVNDQKVNLGQGTYKDGNGDPWILPAVKGAKEKIKGANHEYLPILGLATFRDLATKLVLGASAPAVVEGRVASCQALSGTGALHLAALMLYQALGPSHTVYITEPTWSNHRQVFEAVGFNVQGYKYYDEPSGKLDFGSLEQTLEEARPGSILVLHACAHNPSGCDPSEDQWRKMATIIKRRKLFPLFDAAYLGITSGDYDKDAFAIRHFVNGMGIEAAVCASFAKNMGLYGERVGLVSFITQTPSAAAAVESRLAQFIRSEISNPPAFGARIVAAVLGDAELKAEWHKNLKSMSSRITEMRQELFNALVQLGTPGDWERIVEQKGMFCILGLSPDRVLRLKRKSATTQENPDVCKRHAERCSITHRNPEPVEDAAATQVSPDTLCPAPNSATSTATATAGFGSMPSHNDDTQTNTSAPFSSAAFLDVASVADTHVTAYFTYFHPSLPLVHRPTFLTSSPPKLLADIITAIGMLYSAETPGHSHAKAAYIKKSQNLWRQGVDELNRRASYDWRELRKTWMMQSWLLHIVYGAFMDNASHAERVRKMLRSLVDAVRDLGLLKQVVATSANSPTQLQTGAEDSAALQALEINEQWQAYVGEESLKLCIYTLLLLDHHVFSCANIRPLISTVECLWELPQAESLWEAETFELWYERRHQQASSTVSGSPDTTIHSFKGFLSTATQSLLSETPNTGLIAILAASPFAMICVLSNLDALIKDFTRCYYQLPPSPADPSAFHILTQSQTRQIGSALNVLSVVVMEKMSTVMLNSERSVWHACQVLTWSLKLSLCRPDDLLVGGIVENRVFASLVTATHLTVDSYVTFKRTTHATKQRNDEGDGMIAVIDDLTNALSAIAGLDPRLASRESPWITAVSYRLLLTVWRTLHVATADIYEKLSKCNGTLTSRSFGSSILILNSILETVAESSKQQTQQHSPRRLWSFDADTLNETLAAGETDLVNLIVQICKSRSVWAIGPSLVNAIQDAMANAAR